MKIKALLLAIWEAAKISFAGLCVVVMIVATAWCVGDLFELLGWDHRSALPIVVIVAVFIMIAYDFYKDILKKLRKENNDE